MLNRVFVILSLFVSIVVNVNADDFIKGFMDNLDFQNAVMSISTDNACLIHFYEELPIPDGVVVDFTVQYREKGEEKNIEDIYDVFGEFISSNPISVTIGNKETIFSSSGDVSFVVPGRFLAIFSGHIGSITGVIYSDGETKLFAGGIQIAGSSGVGPHGKKLVVIGEPKPLTILGRILSTILLDHDLRPKSEEKSIELSSP